MNEKALKGHVKNQHSQRYDCREKECKEGIYILENENT